MSVAATAPLVSTGGAAPILSCPTCVTTCHADRHERQHRRQSADRGKLHHGNSRVTGAIAGHPVAVSASDGSLPNGFIILSAAVTTADTVTVQLCATGSVTPTAITYN